MSGASGSEASQRRHTLRLERKAQLEGTKGVGPACQKLQTGIPHRQVQWWRNRIILLDKLVFEETVEVGEGGKKTIVTYCIAFACDWARQW